MSEFEYRIKFVFQDPVEAEEIRDLSDLCSRLIRGSIRLKEPKLALNWVMTSFFLILFGVLGFFTLDMLDQIVYGDLWDYGLVFSMEWHLRYYTIEKMTYVFLAVIIFVGVVFLVFSLYKTRLIWKHRRLIRRYSAIFTDDTEAEFSKYHKVQVYLYKKEE